MLLQDKLPFANLSPNDQAKIRAWATLCPFTHGTAVYMARFIDTAWVDYTNDWELSNPIMAARLSPQKGLSLYPNPTTGYVRIESAGSSLAVYDLLGKEHYRSEMHDTHSLFIQDWSQGVYVVKTYDSQGKLVGAQKLIKNK